ncbi:MAG: AI-2E family transporter [Bacilli bacterium]|nr:AI-2E family transporter [Bacilli bacterium]
MIKNKIDYKLINLAILMLIIFLIYKTGSLWLGILGTIFKISFPFIVGFVIAYALYPFVDFLQRHKVPKFLAIFIIITIVLALMSVIIFGIIPMIFGQLPNLFNGIISFIKEMSIKLDIDFEPIQNSLATSFNDIIIAVGKYVSNGAINIISVSISYMTTALISFAATLYFLSDMKAIRTSIKKHLRRKSKKLYQYVALLDDDMKNYLTGFTRIILISLVEYTLAYTFIGHPYALILGFLAMLANLIPYFGGVVTNTIAAVTSFVISPKLFIRTVITFIILSTIDGYVINPLVYGKTNKVHPLIVIMSVFVGSALFGIIGILISLPLAIICITTYKYFKDDINDKIEDIKVERKNN